MFTFVFFLDVIVENSQNNDLVVQQQDEQQPILFGKENSFSQPSNFYFKKYFYFITNILFLNFPFLKKQKIQMIFLLKEKNKKKFF